MKTIQNAIDWAYEKFEAADLFYGHGSDNPWDEAVYLVMHIAGQPLDAGEEVLPLELNLEQTDQIKNWVETRIKNKIPLAYLMHRAFFAGLEFYVDERVIIPRSPIAELIETSFEPYLEITEVDHVLDLCCGSGCIGLAMAMYFDFIKVDLVDLSFEALEVAKINKSMYEFIYKLEDRVAIIQSDLFGNLKNLNNKKYDLILCNPPYVDQKDFNDMPKEFSHEPEMALISGQDGLDLTRRILSEAANYLTDHGILILEVGNSAIALEAAYPHLDFLWLEFEKGGVGVCLLTKEQISALT